MLENLNIYWKGSVQNEMGERLTEEMTANELLKNI
jgi:hypothetical protein